MRMSVIWTDAEIQNFCQLFQNLKYVLEDQ